MSSHFSTHLFSSSAQTQQLLRHLSRTPLPHETLFLYHNLRTTNVFTLDTFSFPPLLKAVSKLSALTYGLEIHGLASKLGFLSDPFIQTALIAMYVSLMGTARMVILMML